MAHHCRPLFIKKFFSIIKFRYSKKKLKTHTLHGLLLPPVSPAQISIDAFMLCFCMHAESVNLKYLIKIKISNKKQKHFLNVVRTMASSLALNREMLIRLMTLIPIRWQWPSCPHNLMNQLGCK